MLGKRRIFKSLKQCATAPCLPFSVCRKRQLSRPACAPRPVTATAVLCCRTASCVNCSIPRARVVLSSQQLWSSPGRAAAARSRSPARATRPCLSCAATAPSAARRGLGWDVNVARGTRLPPPPPVPLPLPESGQLRFADLRYLPSRRCRGVAGTPSTLQPWQTA